MEVSGDQQVKRKGTHVGDPPKTELDGCDAGCGRERVEVLDGVKDLWLEPLGLEDLSLPGIGVEPGLEPRRPSLQTLARQNGRCDVPASRREGASGFQRLLLSPPRQHAHCEWRVGVERHAEFA